LRGLGVVISSRQGAKAPRLKVKDKAFDRRLSLGPAGTERWRQIAKDRDSTAREKYFHDTAPPPLRVKSTASPMPALKPKERSLQGAESFEILR
jgi:hypothetical protein